MPIESRYPSGWCSLRIVVLGYLDTNPDEVEVADDLTCGCPLELSLLERAVRGVFMALRILM